MARVLVTDAGRGSAMSIIRSLGQRGFEVVAADSNARSPGFVSRYAAGRLRYPPPMVAAEAAVEAVLGASRDRGIDLVIPVGEEMVALLSSARGHFDGVAALALPEADALEVTRDKLATVDLANRVGVPTPRTVLVRTAAEAVHHASEFRWPIVMKPRASRSMLPSGLIEAFGVTYAADRVQLEEEMTRLEGRTAVLLQEYCPGEAHGVGLLMDRGTPLLAFQHRRLREVPFTGGPSSLRESVALDSTLLDYSVRLLESLAWTGPAMVEFKLGSDGARLIEINGRLWGSLALAVKSGVDLPGRLVDLYIPGRAKHSLDPNLSYSIGIRSRDLGLELNWIASVLGRRRLFPFLPAPTRREALQAALRLVDPRDGFDVLSVRDPLPGLAEIAGIAVKIAGRVASSLRPRQAAPARL